jgi:hypothetical protein
MSVDYRDARIEKPRRSRNFWTPIWITAIIGAGGIAFSAGQYLTQQQWGDDSKASLAIEAMRSPSGALDEAERQLLADRIDFSVYRDLLRAALSRTDSEVRNAAYRSIHTVLASDRGYAELLKKELASMPTQVFIVATLGSASDAQDIEQKLKRRETAVVIQDPSAKAISKTQVLCHGQDICKQSGQSVIDVLHEEGYQIDEPKLGDTSTMALANWIEIQLAETKPGKTSKPLKPSKSVIAKARRHPKEPAPPVVAQE